MTAAHRRSGSGGGVPAGEREHLAVRPSWNCLRCARPWPCADARATLLAEFRRFPSVLAIYMSAQMEDASRDFTARGHQPTDLYDRFMSWLRTPSRTETASESVRHRR